MLGRIASYELLEIVGEGGMGVVFRARDVRLDRVVAVKLLRDEFARDAEYRARFQREARAEASLNHPGIATCFDVGEGRLEPADLLGPAIGGSPLSLTLYLAMEYVPGGDLTGLVNDRPIAVPKVLDLMTQIAAGLESAHRAGVIHRDLKPTNIRVMPDGQVKIVDFGLSRIARPRASEETPSLTTSQGRVMGTVHFMAPEQTHGRTVDPRSDLFSLGVIAYQLITGKLPFTGDSHFDVAEAVAHHEPPPLARYASGVPDELERVVRKLIAKDPEHRYQSAHEVRTDLLSLQQGTVVRWTHAPRRQLRVAAAVAATTAIALGAWWAWETWGPRPVPSIAVMPIQNRTGDPRLDYHCDGIAAGVQGHLVRGTRFNVASLSSARDIDPAERGTEAVVRELGVGLVLEGSLHRDQGITYLDVQLVEGRKGFVAWMERFPYALQDAAEIEQKIVRGIVRKVGGRWFDGRADRTIQAPPSLSAYDLFLRAESSLLDPGDPQNLDKSLELYAKALEADPEFALAWAGRSQALVRIYKRDKDAGTLARAEEAANRAIHLNPELLEARVARAQIFRSTSRYDKAIEELQEVLRINPNWDEAILQLAATYREGDDPASAEAIARQAVTLRPGYWRNWNMLGGLRVRLGDYDGARAAFRKIMVLIPGKNLGYEQLAAIESKQGDYAAARAIYERLPTPVRTGALATNIGTAYFFERRLADARRYYVLALEFEPRNPECWTNLGDLHAREGDAESARIAYTKAVQLLEEILHVDPKNLGTKLDRALSLAKAGQCPAAEAALAEIVTALSPDDAENAHRMAKLNALCQRRAAALAAIRRAIALGFSPRVILQEDEFKALALDPRFVALTQMKQS